MATMYQMNIYKKINIKSSYKFASAEKAELHLLLFNANNEWQENLEIIILDNIF